MHDPARVPKSVFVGGGHGGGVVFPPKENEAFGPFVEVGEGWKNVVSTLEEYLKSWWDDVELEFPVCDTFQCETESIDEELNAMQVILF